MRTDIKWCRRAETREKMSISFEGCLAPRAWTDCRALCSRCLVGVGMCAAAFSASIRVRRGSDDRPRRLGRPHRQRVDPGAGRVARTGSRLPTDSARRPRQDPRGLSIPGHRGHAGQPTLAPQRPPLRPGPGQDGRHPQAQRGRSVRVVKLPVRLQDDGAHTFQADGRAFGAEAGDAEELRMDGSGARRLPAAPAEPHHSSTTPATSTRTRPTRCERGNIVAWEQHLADRLEGTAGSDRRAHGAASRFSTARCGCSRVPSAPQSYSLLVSSGGR